MDFGNAPGVTWLRAPAGRATRPYLVFIRAGATPIAQPKWALDAENRLYDIMANFYAPPAAGCWLLDRADYVTGGGLSKFHAAKLLLGPELVHRYEGVLLLDDDVETYFDPGEFAAFSLKRGFALSQAALTPDSAANWAITLQHPSCVWRQTNLIEVMAPFFSRDLLKLAIQEFDFSISSWGLDILWGTRYASRGFGVIDLYTMAHRNRSDGANGPFYQYLRRIGIDPQDDLTRVFQLLGIEKFEVLTRNVVFLGLSVQANTGTGAGSASVERLSP